MNLFALCGFGVCAACVTFLLKHTEPRIAPLAAAAAGIVMTVYIAPQIAPVFGFARDLAAQSGAGTYFSLMIKSLGIALVCELSSEICRDLGENAAGSRIELAGKAAILIISLPVIKRIFEFIKELI